jgi:bifunctional enzyme CysN/CysC
VRVLPSGRTSTVERIVTYDGDLDQGGGRPVGHLTLADEVDCSRGDVLARRRSAARGRRPVRGDDHVDGDEPMLPGPPVSG